MKIEIEICVYSITLHHHLTVFSGEKNLHENLLWKALTLCSRSSSEARRLRFYGEFMMEKRSGWKRSPEVGFNENKHRNALGTFLPVLPDDDHQTFLQEAGPHNQPPVMTWNILSLNCNVMMALRGAVVFRNWIHNGSTRHSPLYYTFHHFNFEQLRNILDV